MVALDQMVLYYSSEMKLRDGSGWCVDFLKGTHCYRFRTVKELCEFIEENSEHLERGGNNVRVG